MRTSLINRTPGDVLVVLRKSYLDLCDGDRNAAILLSFFEYWHNIKSEMVSKQKYLNDVAEQGGDGRPHDETLLQWHTRDDIYTGCLGEVAKNKILAARKKLIKLGFLEERRNPNPRYGFDKTIFFLLNTCEINSSLARKSAKTVICTDRASTYARSVHTVSTDRADGKHDSCISIYTDHADGINDLGTPITENTTKSTTKRENINTGLISRDGVAHENIERMKKAVSLVRIYEDLIKSEYHKHKIAIDEVDRAIVGGFDPEMGITAVLIYKIKNVKFKQASQNFFSENGQIWSIYDEINRKDIRDILSKDKWREMKVETNKLSEIMHLNGCPLSLPEEVLDFVNSLGEQDVESDTQDGDDISDFFFS